MPLDVDQGDRGDRRVARTGKVKMLKDYMTVRELGQLAHELTTNFSRMRDRYIVNEERTMSTTQESR